MRLASSGASGILNESYKPDKLIKAGAVVLAENVVPTVDLVLSLERLAYLPRVLRYGARTFWALPQDSDRLKALTGAMGVASQDGQKERRADAQPMRRYYSAALGLLGVRKRLLDPRGAWLACP